MRHFGSPRVVLTDAVVVILLATTACGAANTADRADTSTRTKPFAGYVRTPPLQVAGVSLPTVDGTVVGMAAKPGGFRLVYFGYTFCPDVCPTTMATVREALRTLPEADRSRIDVAMVTIDPARDTAEDLSAYLTTFVADGIAMRTDDQELLRAATAAFGADYRITTIPDGDPEVSHTGDVYAVDEEGEVVIAWPFGIAVKPLRGDLIRLLDGDRPSSDPTTGENT